MSDAGHQTLRQPRDLRDPVRRRTPGDDSPNGVVPAPDRLGQPGACSVHTGDVLIEGVGDVVLRPLGGGLLVGEGTAGQLDPRLLVGGAAGENGVDDGGSLGRVLLRRRVDPRLDLVALDGAHIRCSFSRDRDVVRGSDVAGADAAHVDVVILGGDGLAAHRAGESVALGGAVVVERVEALGLVVGVLP